MKAFKMKKEWFEETDNTNRYVIKFGDYYFYEAWDSLDYMNLNLKKDIQAASWLTEEKAIEISGKFDGEICKLNVEVNIVEEEKFMRIDDDNKIVWCSEELLNWHSRKVSRATAYYAVADAIDTYAGNQEFKDMFSGSKEFEMYLIAMLNHYTFKLEQPKKYYWRKKKEHLAQFEDFNMNYLNAGKDGYLPLRLHNCEVTHVYEVKFTEQEARELLKDDFNMFEKVECE